MRASAHPAPAVPSLRSVPLEGKNMIFDEDVFPDLVALLEDESAEVRANAAGTLMYAAVTTQGECRRRRREGPPPPRSWSHAQTPHQAVGAQMLSRTQDSSLAESPPEGSAAGPGLPPPGGSPSRELAGRGGGGH